MDEQPTTPKPEEPKRKYRKYRRLNVCEEVFRELTKRKHDGWYPSINCYLQIALGLKSPAKMFADYYHMDEKEVQQPHDAKDMLGNAGKVD